MKRALFTVRREKVGGWTDRLTESLMGKMDKKKVAVVTDMTVGGTSR